MARVQGFSLLASALLLVMWPLNAAAQRRPDGPRRPESRDRGAFFEALRELHMDSPNKELFDLINHAKIRQEIHLGEADAEQIQKNGSAAIKAIFDIRKANEGLSTSKDELKQQMRAVLAPLDASSYEILQRSEVDFKRLLGLYVQARSYRALLNDKVAEQIGLNGPALTEFRKVRSESWRAIMEDTRKAMEKEIRNTPPGTSPREAIGNLFKQAEKKLDNRLAEQLTPQQLDALEQLKGAPFEFPERLFSFPPPGGRGRGERNDERRDDCCDHESQVARSVLPQ